MKSKLAGMIDHTLLKPTATVEQVKTLCSEAVEYGFASVCVNPFYVPLAAGRLKGTGVMVCTVIGFPLGSGTTEAKIFEARNALGMGADELDYVLNVSSVLNGTYDMVSREMAAFAGLRAEHPALRAIKVILETCYLSDEQIVRVCGLAREAGLDFVKTSTGFGSGGATVEHVRLMRETVGPAMGVKASGGVRTYGEAAAMVAAGATRIGTSSGVAIVS